LAELPSREELEEAVSRLKNGKSGGSSGVMLEMVKAACQAGPCLPGRPCPHSLGGEVCSQGLGRCRDSTHPQEGEILSDRNNWRGISLLDVVGKVTARYCKIGHNSLLRRNCPSHNVVSTKARYVQTLFLMSNS